MEMPAPKSTFPAGSFSKRWKAAKTNFKTTTKKKKPAPSKQEQSLWVKVQTLDDRQGTNLNKLITHAEDAIAACFNGLNTYQNAENAYKAFSAAMKGYTQFLDTADNKMAKMDQQVWDTAVAKLKIECQHMQSELRGWLLKAQQQQSQQSTVQTKTRRSLDELLQAAIRESYDTISWVGSTQARQGSAEDFRTRYKKEAGDIQKLLNKLHRMPITQGQADLVLTPPQALLVQLNAYVAGRQPLTTDADRQQVAQGFTRLLSDLTDFLEEAKKKNSQ